MLLTNGKTCIRYTVFIWCIFCVLATDVAGDVLIVFDFSVPRLMMSEITELVCFKHPVFGYPSVRNFFTCVFYQGVHVN